MAYADKEARRKYAAEHYAKNKEKYNPSRAVRAQEIKNQMAVDIKSARLLALASENKCLKSKERECRNANKPLTKIPEKLHGQLAVILREHYANRLPKNKKSRSGLGFPLSAWMKGARPGLSKIMAVCDGFAKYPYTTQRASSEVLHDRIANRYRITPFQATLLTGIINCKYKGQCERAICYLNTGVDGVEYYSEKSNFDVHSKSHDLFIKSCEKFGLKQHDIPLRAVLDPKVTHIFLLVLLTDAISKRH